MFVFLLRTTRPAEGVSRKRSATVFSVGGSTLYTATADGRVKIGLMPYLRNHIKMMRCYNTFIHVRGGEKRRRETGHDRNKRDSQKECVRLCSAAVADVAACIYSIPFGRHLFKRASRER
jgi:hypothetical protein